MSKPEIHVIAKMWPPYLEALKEAYVVHDRTHDSDPAAFALAAPRIRAMTGGGDSQVTADILNKLPALEMISVFGVGYDRYDLAAIKARGISLTNTPDVLTDDVADMGMSLMLSIARSIPQADTFVRAENGQAVLCHWGAR